MNILPSKNFSLVLGTIIFSSLLITGAFYFTDKYQNSGVRTSAEEMAQASQTQKEILSLDSDQDNLPDWEETLWGADPHNPDTDGDGLTDGEEVKTGHNPLVKGPKDLLTDDLPTLVSGQTKNTPVAEADNITTDLAIDFFQHYLELKRTNPNLTTADKDALINQALAQTPIDLKYKTYSLKELNISTNLNEDKSTVITYKENLKQVFASASNPKNTENEIDILTRALQNIATSSLSSSELKKLDPIINSYNSIVKGLVLVEAPNRLALYHLDLVNAYNRVYQNIKYLRDKFSDPLVLLSVIKDYEDSVLDMATALVTLAEKIEK